MEPLNFMPCSVRNKGLDDVKEESLEHGNHLKGKLIDYCMYKLAMFLSYLIL